MNSRRMSPLRQIATQIQLGLAGLFVPTNGSISIL